MEIKKPEVSSDLAARLAGSVEQPTQESDTTPSQSNAAGSSDVVEKAVPDSVFADVRELSVADNVNQEIQPQTGEGSQPSPNLPSEGIAQEYSDDLPTKLSVDFGSTLFSLFGISPRREDAALGGKFQVNALWSFGSSVREAATSLTDLFKNPEAVNLGRMGIQRMIAGFQTKFATFENTDENKVDERNFGAPEGANTKNNADGSVTESYWSTTQNGDGSFTIDTTSVTTYEDGSKFYQEKSETIKLGKTESSKQASLAVNSEGNTGDIVATETSTAEDDTVTTTVVLGAQNEDGTYDYAWSSRDSNGEAASGSTGKGQKLEQELLSQSGDLLDPARRNWRRPG